MTFFKISIGILITALLISLAQAEVLSSQIDNYFKEYFQKNGITATPPVNDSTFLKRAYLNILGRIPTAIEAKQFIDSKEKNKRDKLLKELSLSHAYSGKVFLFYADLLRLKTANLQNGLSFHSFLYEAATTNMPYDKMVYEMLTAEGHVADNPAASYYLRDRGMLLDNVSNSMQVFLGTQIGCAQCHDDPFNSTTQLDFYKLAAFSDNIEYNSSPKSRKVIIDLAKNVVKDTPKKLNKINTHLDPKKQFSVAKKFVKPSLNLFRYHSKNTVNTNTHKTLKLPNDYQYADAKPSSPVTSSIDIENFPPLQSGNKVDFANWVISPSNKMFSKVLANRLWNLAFGYPLASTLDNWKTKTKISHPELLDIIAQDLVSNNYNVKKTLLSLFQTNLFQAQSSHSAPPKGTVYDFHAPLMRRLSAYQIYDSIITLRLGVLDNSINHSRKKTYEQYLNNYEKLDALTSKQLITLSQQYTQKEKQKAAFQREKISLKNQIAKAKKENKHNELKQLRLQYVAFQKKTKKTSQSEMSSSMMGMTTTQSTNNKGLLHFIDTNKISFKPNYQLRSYENPQPFQASSIARKFGATDAAAPSNTHDKAAITQALTLLNGHEVNNLLKHKSVLSKILNSKKSSTEKLNTLFLSVFSRYPTPQEEEEYKDLTADKTSLSSLTRAMLNSNQFFFIK